MTRGWLFLVPLLLTSTLAPAINAGDWPHWRGPTRDGRAADDADPPVKWDTKTNIRWKAALPGKGSSTPLVVGNRLFVTTAIDTGEKGAIPQVPRPKDADGDSVRYKRMTKPSGTVHHFVVLCLDADTGKELWKHTAAKQVPHEGIHPTHSYAAGSPATDGKTLVVSFGSAGTHAYSLEGKHLWSRDFGLMETRLGWGEAVTPAIHADKVYVAHDHEGPSFLVALDLATGKTVWRKERDEPSAWTTPVIVPPRVAPDAKPESKRTLVVLPGHRKTRAYDAATGEVVWESLGLTVNTIPTAIHRDGILYVMSGYRDVKGGALDAATGKVLWQLKSGTPYVPSPLLVGERLYFTAANEPRLTSVKTTDGSTVIDRAVLPRLRQLYASPVEAKGRIYLPDRDGTTLVFATGDKRGEPLAVNALGETIDASPVIVGKRLYLRGEKHLWCIEEPKEKAKQNAAGEKRTVRVYFIGNSVTDTVRYSALAKLAESRDITMNWGRTMIPGAPLEWIYRHPGDGFHEPRYGRWKEALTEHAWDVVSLQPFDRHLREKKERKPGEEDMGDVARIRTFAELAHKKNPDVQIYIYSRWPRVTMGGKAAKFDKNDYDPSKPGSGNDLSKVDDYHKRWQAKYTGGWDSTNETRDYFETLLREVRKECDFLKKPALLVPVGDAMAELHTQMQAGKVPGYKSIYQLYKDGIHLNEPGSYFVGCVFFATFFGESPEKLPHEPYGKIDAKLAAHLQRIAWEVVSKHPLTGRR